MLWNGKGLVYESSLGLGLETTRSVHSAKVWLANLIPRPQTMSYIYSLVPRPEKQSGNFNEFMYQHCAAWDTTIAISLLGGSPTTSVG